MTRIISRLSKAIAKFLLYHQMNLKEKKKKKSKFKFQTFKTRIPMIILQYKINISITIIIKKQLQQALSHYRHLKNYEALLSLDCFRTSEPNSIKIGKFRFCAGHLIHFNTRFYAFHS